jgi:hypothetical protein
MVLEFDFLNRYNCLLCSNSLSDYDNFMELIHLTSYRQFAAE